MWKRAKGGRPAQATRLELCDLCAVTFPAGEAVSGYVPDSSCVHPANDWFDGLRRVIACGDAHFEVLREIYRHRPFVKEELWAAKISRTLVSAPSGLTLEQLGCRTGLDESEIRRAVAWQREQVRRRTEP
ncbi:hypothetical protein ABZ281_45920 [Streptomyces sp. NPDC006265]|uniref:hypothetical protein n=1 Tax=Streptomyces sp. NPDC006265 TaxID=3156740 RepID=UPI0033AF9B0F